MAIEAREIVRRFVPGERAVLNGIQLKVGDGEFVALSGRSGSGKSSLLYILSTLDSPTSGQILIDGKDIATLSENELHAIRNRHIGFIFQFHYLLPELNVLENVLMPTRKTRSSQQARSRALALLRDLDLEDKTERMPRQLSGGEQQRVAIARALIMAPRYLFADEPTGSLDSENGRKVIDQLLRLNREHSMTVILVTHERDYALAADRILTLVDGKVVLEERPAKNSAG